MIDAESHLLPPLDFSVSSFHTLNSSATCRSTMIIRWEKNVYLETESDTLNRWLATSSSFRSSYSSSEKRQSVDLLQIEIMKYFRWFWRAWTKNSHHHIKLRHLFIALLVFFRLFSTRRFSNLSTTTCTIPPHLPPLNSLPSWSPFPSSTFLPHTECSPPCNPVYTIFRELYWLFDNYICGLYFYKKPWKRM